MKRLWMMVLLLALLAGCASLPDAGALQDETRYRIIYEASEKRPAGGAYSESPAPTARDEAVSPHAGRSLLPAGETTPDPSPAGSGADTAPSPSPAGSAEIPSASERVVTPVIGNKNSKVYHLPSCDTLPAEKNRVPFASAAEAEQAGYHPCARCLDSGTPQ